MNRRCIQAIPNYTNCLKCDFFRWNEETGEIVLLNCCLSYGTNVPQRVNKLTLSLSVYILSSYFKSANKKQNTVQKTKTLKKTAQIYTKFSCWARISIRYTHKTLPYNHSKKWKRKGKQKKHENSSTSRLKMLKLLLLMLLMLLNVCASNVRNI